MLKVDVEGPQLRALNKRLMDEFGTSSEFKEYKPHLTIAYLKKGMGKK